MKLINVFLHIFTLCTLSIAAMNDSKKITNEIEELCKEKNEVDQKFLTFFFDKNENTKQKYKEEALVYEQKVEKFTKDNVDYLKNIITQDCSTYLTEYLPIIERGCDSFRLRQKLKKCFAISKATMYALSDDQKTRIEEFRKKTFKSLDKGCGIDSVTKRYFCDIDDPSIIDPCTLKELLTDIQQ